MSNSNLDDMDLHADAENTGHQTGGDDFTETEQPSSKAKNNKMIYGGMLVATIVFGYLIYGMLAPSTDLSSAADPVMAGGQPTTPYPNQYTSAIQPVDPAGVPADAGAFPGVAPGETVVADAAAQPIVPPADPLAPATAEIKPAPAPVAATPEPVKTATSESDDERVKKLEARLADMERRLDIHRRWLHELRDGNHKTVAASRPAPAKRSATASSRTNLPIAATQAPTPVAVAQAPAKVGSVYTLTAAVPGRAHIQTQAGNRMDVALGDTVPDCGSVTKIDTDAGEVVAGKCVIR